MDSLVDDANRATLEGRPNDAPVSGASLTSASEISDTLGHAVGDRALHGEDADALIERADAAMCLAKNPSASVVLHNQAA